MKKNLAVLYGGVSPEHEVSIITAVQLMKQVDLGKYSLVPVYIDKSGTWWTGEKLLEINTYQDLNLRQPQGLEVFAASGEVLGKLMNPDSARKIEVALLCFHGAYGEAGNVQGLLELAGVPYQGPGVTASAVAFDKIMTRQILDAEQIAQTKYIWFTSSQWQQDSAHILSQIEELGYPVFIKPANGGSTIGVARIASVQDMSAAITAVLTFDQRIIVEKEVIDCIEVNMSVLGLEGDARVSVPEQPIKQDAFLSFADKYQRGGGKKSGMASSNRRIPAPISEALTSKLEILAQKVFHIFDCSGVVRIDFFVNPSSDEIFVTEINTIPGSMSYYLWEATGLTYPALIDRLVEIAEIRARQKSQLVTSFENNLLQKASV